MHPEGTTRYEEDILSSPTEWHEAVANLNARGLGPTGGGTSAWSLEVHDSVDSTNRVAFGAGLGGAPEGLLILAETQTAGRGRLARPWHSPPHQNLYLSVVLRPDVPIAQVPLLNFVAALAVNRAFHRIGVESALKWPNDVLVRATGKKLAGILAELRTDPGGVEFVVVGIGCNLNLDVHQLPPELQARASSALEILGHPVDRGLFLSTLLEGLSVLYQSFLQGELSALFTEWRCSNMTLGETVRYPSGNDWKVGRATDIDAQGSLLVEGPGGREVITAGDVELVRVFSA